jgi:glycosyltransferase involved in cell wall biosynthesis
MIKLSATVITFNEEHNIARCLEALQKVADEIVVIDSFSTDKTQSICEEYGVKFMQNKFEGHIEQKNFALEQTEYDNILSVDADEVLSPQLQTSIMKMKENMEFDGYVFNRLNNYCGKWIYHCGWYPDKKLRIIKKGKAQWTGENPHDFLKLNNSEQKEGFLIGDLHHYSYNSISEHVAQANKFTSISSKAAYLKGVRVSRYKGISRGILQFFRDYLLKGGILDGHYGLVICLLNAYSYFLKFEKIYEYQINEKKNKV